MTTPTADLPGIFRRAVQVIQTNGLHKGAFVAPPCVQDASGNYHVNPDDEALRPVDIVGAIRIACGQLPTCSGGFLAECAIRYASDHMLTTAPETDGEPDYIEHLCFWNDLGTSSPFEVVGRLDRLALNAEVDAERSVAA